MISRRDRTAKIFRQPTKACLSRQFKRFSSAVSIAQRLPRNDDFRCLRHAAGLDWCVGQDCEGSGMTRRGRAKRLVMMLAGAATLASSELFAATQWWDLNGPTSGASFGSTASGTWDSTSSNWRTNLESSKLEEQLPIACSGPPDPRVQVEQTVLVPLGHALGFGLAQQVQLVLAQRAQGNGHSGPPGDWFGSGHASAVGTGTEPLARAGAEPGWRERIGDMTSGGTSTTARQRSWWGWGRADAALSDEECVALAALVPGLPDRPRPVRGSRTWSCRTVPAEPAVRRCRSPRPRRPGRAHVRQGVPGRRPGAVGRAAAAPPTPSPARRTRTTSCAVLDWAGVRRGRRRPLRRRQLGRRRRRVPRRATAGVSMDLTALDRVLEIDRVSRAARIQARRPRPRAGGPAAPARPDAAALPAELRVLDPRRLAGDPRRRATTRRCTPTSTTSSSRCGS